jgi:hypothetical protein
MDLPLSLATIAVVISVAMRCRPSRHRSENLPLAFLDGLLFGAVLTPALDRELALAVGAMFVNPRNLPEGGAAWTFENWVTCAVDGKRWNESRENRSWKRMPDRHRWDCQAFSGGAGAKHDVAGVEADVAAIAQGLAG